MSLKVWLFALSLALSAAAMADRAEAQNYPWCAIYSMGDEVTNCGFVSFEQCMATVRGIGGFCHQNTMYRPPVAAPAPQRRSSSESREQQ